MKVFQKPNALPPGKSGHSKEPRGANFFCPPLSDFEIIEIQDLFMRPSIHYLETKNMATGRELLNKFLFSLNHYQKIGFLSSVDYPWKKEVVNIYKMAEDEILHNHQNTISDVIEKYCLEIPFIDFAWIELTSKLCAEISENQIKNICTSLSSHGQIPVIVVRYL